jgi:hypothetical protein
MENIHLIPTDKPSIITFKKDSGHFRYRKAEFLNNSLYQNYNIYITNSEEIKEGDWHLVWLRDKWEVLNYMPSIGYRKECLGKEVCKITITTDSQLIKDGVQPIPDDFLEYFVGVPFGEIKEVEVEWVKTPDGIFYHQYNVPYGCYKIIRANEF